MASQPFSWSEYLRLAQDLGKRSDEASLRSAISRAYYYVYHLGLDRARSNNFTFSEGGCMYSYGDALARIQTRIAGGWERSHLG